MDSAKCEVFLTAVDMGSLTAAAEFLGYTQPGITRIIRSLEEETGFRLLTRSRHGVTLTDNGREMMPLFREIVRAGSNAEELCAEIRGMLRGNLVIGSYHSVSAIWLPEIIKKFSEDYPGIRIRLKEGGNQDLARWLSNRSIDCCFAIEPSANIVYDWIPIREDELMAWLPADHPLAGAASYPISRLGSESFISTMPGQDTELDRLLSKEKLHPDILYSTADAYTAYRMVEAGLGVSINNRLFLESWNGNVAAVPLYPPQIIEFGIAVPSLKEASPAARRFIECVQDALKV